LQADYFELYTHAALALKAASPKLRVGGPATCCADCWLEDFVIHMDNNSVPYVLFSVPAGRHPTSHYRCRGLAKVIEILKSAIAPF
jgi:hypothetical protein